jgi:hypothetical protein
VTPTCAGKKCGDDDGCGKACETGSCPSGQTCVTKSTGPVCDLSCPLGPQCGSKHCGDPDGCGGICTSAPCVNPTDTCNSGSCSPCKPTCAKCGDPDGCLGTCTTGACPKGYVCGGIGTCSVDPLSKWSLTVTKGTIPVDKSWNLFSKPDSMVCVWISTTRMCTQESLDTLSPSWGCTISAYATGAQLLAGIDMESFDNDRSGAGSCSEAVSTAPGESICTKGAHVFKATEISSGLWSAGCADMTWSGTLSPL